MIHDSALEMGGTHALWWLLWITLGGALVYWILGRSADRKRRPEDKPDCTEPPQEIHGRRVTADEVNSRDGEQRETLPGRDAGKPG